MMSRSIVLMFGTTDAQMGGVHFQSPQQICRVFQLSKRIWRWICILIQKSSQEKSNYQNKLDAIVIQYGRHKSLICKCCEILFNMVVDYIPIIVYQRRYEL